jgi:nitrogen fixation protein NifU and related proteins
VRTHDASEIARSDRSRSRILSVYSPDLLDHFEHPRNSGTLESPDAVAQLENPVCGDVLALSARISDGRIAELRFKAKGCVPSMACGSALTTLASGRTLAEASAIKAEDVEALVGGLPAASGHASHLAMDALTLLLRKHRNAEK